MIWGARFLRENPSSNITILNTLRDASPGEPVSSRKGDNTPTTSSQSLPVPMLLYSTKGQLPPTHSALLHSIVAPRRTSRRKAR